MSKDHKKQSEPDTTPRGAERKAEVEANFVATFWALTIMGVASGLGCSTDDKKTEEAKEKEEATKEDKSSSESGATPKVAKAIQIVSGQEEVKEEGEWNGEEEKEEKIEVELEEEKEEREWNGEGKKEEKIEVELEEEEGEEGEPEPALYYRTPMSPIASERTEEEEEKEEDGDPPAWQTWWQQPPLWQLESEITDRSESEEYHPHLVETIEPSPQISLKDIIVLNEIGLAASKEQTVIFEDIEAEFHIDANLDFIELHNISNDVTVNEQDIWNLSLKTIGPSGVLGTIDLVTFSETADSYALSPGEHLVLYSDGQWAIYDVDGELKNSSSFGTYTLNSPWNFGDNTSDALAVNLLQRLNAEQPNEVLINIDELLANNIDMTMFTNDTDWLGANERGATGIPGSSSFMLASLIGLTQPALLHETFSGLLGDQDSVLVNLDLTRPTVGESSTMDDIDGSLNVFSRVYLNIIATIDSDQESDWTITTDATQGMLNLGGEDFSLQDPTDDFAPLQGENFNPDRTAKIDLAGQTVIDDSLDGNPSDNNSLFGDRASDFLYGDNGNDKLFGNDHNDLLFGAAGNDQLYGEKGADLLIDIDGQDALVGGSGNDILAANATIFGELVPMNDAGDILIGDDIVLNADVSADTLGQDVIFGGTFADEIYGDVYVVSSIDNFMMDPFGEEEPVAHGVGAKDWIDGGAGNDTIFGQGGDDEILGGEGNDIIYGGAGDDWMDGEAGEDTFFYLFDNLDGNDVIYNFDNDGDIHDTINLDALFDELGTAEVDRAGDVLLDDSGPDVVLTIDGVSDFSITFTNAAVNTAAAFDIGSSASDDIVVS